MNSSGMSTGSLVLQNVPGRGIGAISARNLSAGENVIESELPILLYPQFSAIPYVCMYCLRRFSVLQAGMLVFLLSIVFLCG